MALRNFIESIESYKAGFLLWITVILAVGFVRSVFEGFLEVFHTTINPHALFLHYPISWICMMLTFLLILKFFSKETVVKVTKVVIVFFLIILLVPVIDYFASGGQGFDLEYVLGTPSYLVSQFFSFYGDFPDGVGVTPGQKFVLLLSFALSSIYCWTKTKNALRSAGCFIALYTAAAFYAFFPSFIGMLMYAPQKWAVIAPVYFPKPLVVPTDLAFVFLIAIQLFVWLLLWNKNKLRALLSDLRPFRIMHYVVLMPLFGVLLFYSLNFGYAINPLYVIALLVSAFFAFQASVALNDIADFETDKVSNPRRLLVKKAISKEEYEKIALVQVLISLMLAIIIGYAVFVLMLCSLLLSFIYSMPPLRLKQLPIVSTFTLALISLVWVIAGFFTAGAMTINLLPANFAFFILFFITLSFSAKDLKDTEGDKKSGVRTIPNIFGERRARKIITVLVAASYLTAPFFLGLPLLIFFPLSIAFTMLNSHLILNLKTSEKTLLFVYFVYVFIAVPWLFFL